MATNKQDFLTKSTNIRKQINSEFDNLIERVNTRRNALLSKLEDAVSRYQRLVRESQQAFLQLEQMKVQSRAILNLNLTRGVQSTINYGVDAGIASMKKKISNLNLSFEWTDDFEEMIPDVGTFLTNIHEFFENSSLIDIDYASKKPPQTNPQDPGYDIKCMCVDKTTSYMYAISPTCLLHVFNEFGKLLFNFDKQSPVVTPEGIAMFEDKIYLSCSGRNSINKYRLCGTQPPKLIKTPDISRTELDKPTLMSIDESDGHVYVCDTGNKRVVRYNKFLNYHSKICGKDMFTPLNVKITQTRIVLFVEPSPTPHIDTHPIRLYSKDKHQFLKSLFVQPHGTCFDIDTSGNFLISLGDSIQIYDGDGNLLHVLKCTLEYGYMIRSFAISRKTGSLIISSTWNMLYLL